MLAFSNTSASFIPNTGKPSPFVELLRTPAYDFLRSNMHLGDNIVLLGLGGSYAYGTNVDGSDIDIRGVATRCSEDILSGRDFEQVTDAATDTTIYSFDKFVRLLANCNPNVIEMLGLRPQDYLHISEAGQLLLDNKDAFVTKKCIASFGGYANAQLRRLGNKAVRSVDHDEREAYILRSIERGMEDIKRGVNDISEDAVRIYLADAQDASGRKDLFADISLQRYPVRDFSGILAGINNIVRSYDRAGPRNEQAAKRGKLGKHMMHLVRLYNMCFDMLESGEINTYRNKEHDLLMSIRNGAYLDEQSQPIPAFYELVDDLENKLERLKNTTELPDNIDESRIRRLLVQANEAVVFSDKAMLFQQKDDVNLQTER